MTQHIPFHLPATPDATPQADRPHHADTQTAPTRPGLTPAKPTTLREKGAA